MARWPRNSAHRFAPAGEDGVGVVVGFLDATAWVFLHFTGNGLGDGCSLGRPDKPLTRQLAAGETVVLSFQVGGMLFCVGEAAFEFVVRVARSCEAA